jgi:hypothetical protein
LALATNGNAIVMLRDLGAVRIILGANDRYRPERGLQSSSQVAGHCRDLDSARCCGVYVVLQRNANLEITQLLGKTVRQVPKERFDFVLEKRETHRQHYAARNGNSNR